VNDSDPKILDLQSALAEVQRLREENVRLLCLLQEHGTKLPVAPCWSGPFQIEEEARPYRQHNGEQLLQLRPVPAKNERIFLRWHITLIGVALNGIMRKLGFSYAGWRNAKWRSLERMKGLAGARDLTARPAKASLIRKNGEVRMRPHLSMRRVHSSCKIVPH